MPYVSFSEIASKFKVLFDPQKFFEAHKNDAIFDEVQNIPELAPYLSRLLDVSPKSQKSRFILISSQNLLLDSKISPAFRKKIAVLTLPSPSLAESKSTESLDRKIFRGGFSALLRRRTSAADFFPNYLQTFLNLLGIEKPKQVAEAVTSGSNIIMLDNMSPAEIKKCAALIRKKSPKTKIEISGGITLANIKNFSQLNIDFISVGALTHSAKAVDIGLDIVS